MISDLSRKWEMAEKQMIENRQSNYQRENQELMRTQVLLSEREQELSELKKQYSQLSADVEQRSHPNAIERLRVSDREQLTKSSLVEAPSVLEDVSLLQINQNEEIIRNLQKETKQQASIITKLFEQVSAKQNSLEPTKNREPRGAACDKMMDTSSRRTVPLTGSDLFKQQHMSQPPRETTSRDHSPRQYNYPRPIDSQILPLSTHQSVQNSASVGTNFNLEVVPPTMTNDSMFRDSSHQMFAQSYSTERLSDPDRSKGLLQVCPICSLECSNMSMETFQAHVFDCFDNEADPPETLQPRLENNDRKCPMCEAVYPENVAQGDFEEHKQQGVSETRVHSGELCRILGDSRKMAVIDSTCRSLGNPHKDLGDPTSSYKTWVDPGYRCRRGKYHRSDETSPDTNPGTIPNTGPDGFHVQIPVPRTSNMQSTTLSL
ncbi:hypothetical protein ScPMuIL_012207 [Solemya velum]